MPKTKKTDAQRLSAFSFRYPTHVACILLVPPTGARDDASSLVHWETWCSLLALLPAALWVSSSYAHCPCPSLLLAPTYWPHHALRHFRRAAHSPRSKALPIWAYWPAQLEIPTMLRSECHTRSGACLFRCTARPQCPTRGTVHHDCVSTSRDRSRHNKTRNRGRCLSCQHIQTRTESRARPAGRRSA